MELKKKFENFYNQNVDKVYRYVFFRTGKDVALAEDLVSEIFMKVLEHFNEFDETKSKTAWVITIAHNHLANYWRDRKVTLSIDAHLTDDAEEKAQDTLWFGASKSVWEKSLGVAEAKEFLANLSESERHIVTFHYILGYSYAEIADTLNQSESAVKVTAHRAIKKMRKYI